MRNSSKTMMERSGFSKAVIDENVSLLDKQSYEKMSTANNRDSQMKITTQYTVAVATRD